MQNFDNPKIQKIFEQLNDEYFKLRDAIINPNDGTPNLHFHQISILKGYDVALDFINTTSNNYIQFRDALGRYDPKFIVMSCNMVIMIASIIKTQVDYISMIASAKGFGNDNNLVKEHLEKIAKCRSILELVFERFDIDYKTKTVMDNLLSKTKEVEKFISLKKGCYVATLVYGSESAKEVQQFRYYRDNTLSKYVLGKYFIEAYYKISPSLVKWLSNKHKITKCIKWVLDRIYLQIKNR